MVPGTGGPEGSRGRRDPVPAPTGPLRARRGGMTGRKCRACPPRVRSAIAARGLGGPAPGQPHPEALTLSRPKRKARAIEGEGRCPWHQRGREALRSARALPGEPRPDRGGGGLAEGVCSLFPSEVAGGGAGGQGRVAGALPALGHCSQVGAGECEPLSARGGGEGVKGSGKGEDDSMVRELRLQ